MLQVDNLNANQMQIIDLLCQINESDEIASNTAYYANNNRVDEFKDFVVEMPMKSGADLMHVKHLIKTVESLNLCF